IAERAPELVIVDEAQRIKNWNTIAARALKRIDSPYALVLTGTPLENKLEELISIVQFVDQHRLGPTWKLLHEHQVKDEFGRVTGYAGLEKIGQTLAPILIRRRRSEVLKQLPSRTDQNLLVPMTEPQMVHHQENADIVARIVNRWRRMKFLSDKDQRLLTCALQNMRMSCNSTYLLDQETDHGVKADELAALLDGVFVQPDAKAVVFSQWTRTHDIVIRRLEDRRIGYVSFHGGVPSERRPALVERFRDDPDCRVFLSTDAGAAGLNLQHASTLVNMDLPWNPALLEQRIGRIHRMGQKRPVQIVNFVAKGTIEEGMLSVLAFKRSLSAGILDGGQSEISLGGSRLSRFMKEVENVTRRMGEGDAMAPAEEAASVASAPADSTIDAAAVDEPAVAVETASAAASSERETATPALQDASADPWTVLLQAGVQLASVLRAAGDAQASHPWLERDPASGACSLRLPLPPPETAQRLANALSVIADSLRGSLARQ
ncbi:MAG: ATP-dependent helicase, partial [Burkholderiales bacterium]|nr:ATP-dependent helicase [Burkholderiales bacterium]